MYERVRTFADKGGRSKVNALFAMNQVCADKRQAIKRRRVNAFVLAQIMRCSSTDDFGRFDWRSLRLRSDHRQRGRDVARWVSLALG